MTDEELPITLSGALSEPEEVDKKQANITGLQKLQERTFQNRSRLLDRYHQLPLYGSAREKAITGKKSRWKWEGVASDHPIVQMILSLRMDEDELMEKDDTGNYVLDIDQKERIRLKLQLKQQLTNLLLALQKENDKIFEEVQEVIDLDNRQREHKDKMGLKGSLDQLSDAELLQLAKDVKVIP